jgi:GMP synthase-like glutamine amidotransferase
MRVPTTSRSIHWFQHAPFEGLGTIETWMDVRGHVPTVTRFHANDPFPAINAIDWLIVMGGPMGVYDQDGHPWLADEIELIGKAMAAGKTVLGICLGAQLIAAALGAKVYPNTHKEIGWFPVRLTDEGRRSPLLQGFPPELSVFHWHGDTFDLPAESTHLMTSAGCVNQAFGYGDRVIGLQCHLEVTPASVNALIDHCGYELGGGELARAPFIQTAEQLRRPSNHFPAMHARMASLLDRLWETIA